MKIWRRGHTALEQKSFLEANGIKYKPQFSVKYPDQLRDLVFEIPEDNPAWAELQRRLTREHTYVETEFNDEERLAAEWCIVWGVHSIGGVQLEGYGWHREYYADKCTKCGCGWRQVKPYRLKREPKLGKNQFCSFGSAFELFCTPLAVEVFGRLGVGGFDTWPVLLKSGQQVQALRQVMVNTMAQPAIAEELVEHERYQQTDCPVCGRTWHSDYVRGMLPLRKAALRRDVDFQLTNEWFGNDRIARREVLVSRRVVRLILEMKWKGAELVPIQTV